MVVLKEAMMLSTKWWMRIVGGFYLLQFIPMALLRAPIRALGPKDALARNAGGDPLAMFLVDTWVTFGLEVGAIGLATLIASRDRDQSRALIWTIIGIELSRGIVADIYMIGRRGVLPVLAVWMVIHTVIIVTGLLSLRKAPVVRPTVTPGMRAA
jgi:hypothetical protein